LFLPNVSKTGIQQASAVADVMEKSNSKKHAFQSVE